MKNLSFLILFITMFGYSQTPVDNKGVKRQIQSMVVTKWSKRYFSPRWYYILVHNRYRTGKDMRLVHQLTPTLWSAIQNHKETEDEEAEVDEDYIDELTIALDKEVNPKYELLYKDHLDELFLRLISFDINSSLSVLEKYKNNPLAKNEHYMVIENFQERKKLISESYSPSHEKNLQYDVLIKDIEDYLSLLVGLKRKLEVYNKYAPYLENKNID